MVVKAELSENRVVIWDRDKAKDIYEENFFGKLREDRLDLSLLEAAYLFSKKRIKISGTTIKKFLKYCGGVDSRFSFRYAVYKDLRNRDMPTRTGFKFGCDFRVYNKGVKPLKRGPKQAGEHTKWIVFSVQEGFKFSFPELSRAVRLAHNIRANMLWAVVSKKGKVKYYKISFFKP